MEMRLYLMLFLILALAGCGRGEKPQPPTAEESRQLDGAENMLDNLANEEGPANASAPAGPSNRVN